MDINNSNKINIISGYTEHWENSTTSPDWIEISYFHSSFLVWIVIAITSFYIFNRIMIEFLIRWRKQ